MAGRQSHGTVEALKWLAKETMPNSPERFRVSAAAKKFKVSESTIWRALGQANGKRSQP
jgi:predicted DNA-binding protein (UPF0251 family)